MASPCNANLRFWLIFPRVICAMKGGQLIILMAMMQNRSDIVRRNYFFSIRCLFGRHCVRVIKLPLIELSIFRIKHNARLEFAGHMAASAAISASQII